MGKSEIEGAISSQEFIRQLHGLMEFAHLLKIEVEIDYPPKIDEFYPLRYRTPRRSLLRK